MAAEMNSDHPLKNSTDLDDEESFHNAADSFSTDDDNLAPPEQNPITDPSPDLEESDGNFQEIENLPPDDDLETQIEEPPATAVENPPSIDLIGEKMKQVSDDSAVSSFNVKNKVKRSRRRSSNGKKVGAGIVITSDEEEWNNNGGKRRVYSREEMMGMRFFGVVQQKRLWRDIYNGLGSAAAEYASLVDHAIVKNTKHVPRISHNTAPLGILGVAGSGAINPYNVMVQPYYPTTMMNLKTCYSPDWAPYVNYGF